MNHTKPNVRIADQTMMTKRKATPAHQLQITALTLTIVGCLFAFFDASSTQAQESSLLHVSPARPGTRATNSQIVTQQYNSQDQSRLGVPTPGMMPVAPPQLSAAPLPQQGMPPVQSMRPQPMTGVVDPAAGVTLQRASWMYQPAPPLRTFAPQDIVTIRVDEIARILADGSAEKRRNSLVSSVLSDWINIRNFKIVPDPLADGDPTIAGQSQSTSRAESSIESRESMTFNIAARVVDIRPNGNLVLEARKSYRVNDNLWETSLSGICRAQDIGPDNVVISRDLIDLEIRKEDRGHLRDGYARGWFQRMADRIKPF